MSRAVLLPLAVCLGVGATAVIADEGATGVVAERMDSMKSMASAMKTLAGMLKAPESFDHALALRASETVSSHAESIPKLFPEGSAHPPSRASNAVWDDWDQFVSHAADLQEAALEFGTATEAGTDPAALEPHFNAMAGGCRACHADFRLPG